MPLGPHESQQASQSIGTSVPKSPGSSDRSTFSRYWVAKLKGVRFQTLEWAKLPGEAGCDRPRLSPALSAHALAPEATSILGAVTGGGPGATSTAWSLSMEDLAETRVRGAESETTRRV